MNPPRVWPVFAAWLLAFVGIVALSVLAAAIVRDLYPDLDEAEVLNGLPGLLAGAIASSLALFATVLVVVRPFDPLRLRLRPGRETGQALGVMILGTLALGQTLDSLTVLAGLGHRGSMAVIRRALEGASGGHLFAAVVVIGFLAGAAEEVFFRGYMQTALRERWRPSLAVLVTSLAFAVLHIEWLHALLALGLGLWLGFVTECAGSVLPAVAAHVVNNALFTLLTATVGSPEASGPNLILAGGSALVFAGSLLWLRRWRQRDLAGDRPTGVGLGAT